ncbi:hypothetical protein BTVI_01744 [Pitangus sulphuratus]|nr:hypothetical protein BTVI_02037 [Pitangus sulphuratus]KAJ7427369.1 hypothetical protein BTVI_01744 [Pitangus sulphuratus]
MFEEEELPASENEEQPGPSKRKRQPNQGSIVNTETWRKVAHLHNVKEVELDMILPQQVTFSWELTIETGKEN